MKNQPMEKIAVWIVEDNLLYNKTIVNIINDQPDIECTGNYRSCEEALLALESKPLPDVVLHDIGFEGMNGIVSVELMKRQHPEIQIIMLTVFDDSEHVFKSLCAGATGYILKSSDEINIATAIYDILAGGSPMNSSIARKVIEVFSRIHRVTKEFNLSHRELEILHHIIEGSSNRYIADKLHISPHTVDAHLRSIYEKLHVHSRTQAATKALKERIVTPF